MQKRKSSSLCNHIDCLTEINEHFFGAGGTQIETVSHMQNKSVLPPEKAGNSRRPPVHRMGKQHLCVVPVFLIWKVNDHASLPGNFGVLSGYQSDEGVGQWTQYFDFFHGA